ncbi:MAG: response regulator transcription factor [Prevotellaceae bacterium]|jgi:DNA-binding response OmpR family regulator|nr:response regulator transcription factor [Prevotellaceae bacterium]
MENKNTAILLAEDEENMGTLLCDYLKAKGYQADLYLDGEKAFRGFCTKKYDLCILDVMMPKKDGYSLAIEIRTITPDVPIIFLTAKNIKEDIIQGFSLGADDYMTKPFSIDELVLRIEAVLRRNRALPSEIGRTIFKLGKNTTFYYSRHTLVINDKEIKITTKEAEVLRLLCVNKNNVVDRNSALIAVWNDDSYFNARSMDVYIAKLRQHIHQDPDVKMINVRGKGFKLVY